MCFAAWSRCTQRLVVEVKRLQYNANREECCNRRVGHACSGEASGGTRNLVRAGKFWRHLLLVQKVVLGISMQL